MVGLSLASTNVFSRLPAIEVGSERLNAPDRQQTQQAAQSLPVNQPGDGVGGLSRDALAGVSNTSSTLADQRSDARRNALSVQEGEGGQAVSSTLAQPAESGGSDEASGPNDLTPEEQREVDRLAARDREVRAHEQAHARVGGAFASQPTYDFVTGPDGQQYAVAGEVQIDAAPIPGDPEATIRKLDIVIRAALAPAEPSSQDQAVARQARADLAEAQRQAREQRQAELQGIGEDEDEGTLDSASGDSTEDGEEAGSLDEAIFSYTQNQNAIAQAVFQQASSLFA